MEAKPARGLPVGSSPLIPAERLGEAIGIERLLIKDDSRNPTLSFKDRAVAVAVAKAVDFGMEALACASTGNLAGATAAAAAVVGLPAYVFVPADLEPAKIDHALAYGATVVPIQGTYDDVNRLCLEIADERGWGFVNINLRPFYAEGSKTLAFEIAEGLGWRLPDVIVAPVASGRDVHQDRPRLRRARGDRPGGANPGPLRRRPGGRLRPGRHGLRDRQRRHRARPNPGHDRALAGDRQPGRRPPCRRAGPLERRLDRGDPGRGHRRRRSAGRPGSRGSTPRPPAA